MIARVQSTAISFTSIQAIGYAAFSLDLANAGCQNLLLLGRSGRGELKVDMFGITSVIAVRCDLASADEVCITNKHLYWRLSITARGVFCCGQETLH